jgi:hypothetical protein
VGSRADGTFVPVSGDWLGMTKVKGKSLRTLHQKLSDCYLRRFTESNYLRMLRYDWCVHREGASVESFHRMFWSICGYEWFCSHVKWFPDTTFKQWQIKILLQRSRYWYFKRNKPENITKRNIGSHGKYCKTCHNGDGREVGRCSWCHHCDNFRNLTILVVGVIKVKTADHCTIQASLCFLDDYNYIAAINCDRWAEQERGLFQKR